MHNWMSWPVEDDNDNFVQAYRSSSAKYYMRTGTHQFICGPMLEAGTSISVRPWWLHVCFVAVRVVEIKVRHPEMISGAY